MMDPLPLVSVITPSYNKGPFIEETILSVRDQTYPHIEHIIFDAGSTDDTLGILKKYQDHLDWVSEPDRGQSDAINKGLRKAKGEIVAYLNADDTYLPDAVESAVAFFRDHPEIHMLYGDAFITDEDGGNRQPVICGTFCLRDLVFCQDNIFQPSVFLRRDVITTVGEFDVDLHLAMDLDYWIRTAMVFQIGYLRHPLSVAKIYRDAKSSALMFRYVKEYEHILEKLFRKENLPVEVSGYKNDAYTFIYTKGGLDYLRAQMFRDGFRYLWKGFRIRPFNSLKYACALILRYLTKSGGAVV